MTFELEDKGVLIQVFVTAVWYHTKCGCNWIVSHLHVIHLQARALIFQVDPDQHRSAYELQLATLGQYWKSRCGVVVISLYPDWIHATTFFSIGLCINIKWALPVSLMTACISALLWCSSHGTGHRTWRMAGGSSAWRWLGRDWALAEHKARSRLEAHFFTGPREAWDTWSWGLCSPVCFLLLGLWSFLALSSSSRAGGLGDRGQPAEGSVVDFCGRSAPGCCMVLLYTWAWSVTRSWHTGKKPVEPKSYCDIYSLVPVMWERKMRTGPVVLVSHGLQVWRPPDVGQGKKDDYFIFTASKLSSRMNSFPEVYGIFRNWTIKSQSTVLTTDSFSYHQLNKVILNLSRLFFSGTSELTALVLLHLWVF